MDKVSLKQYLMQGGAWAFTGKVLTALMGLALSALLARMLSPEDMGAYFLAFNLATFFSIVARLGLENTLLRFVSEAISRNQPGRVRAVIQKGLILALIGAAVVAVAVYTVAGTWLAERLFHSRALGAVASFVAIWLVLLAFQFLFGEIFRAFQDIRASVLCGGLITATVTVVCLSLYGLIGGRATLNQVLQWVLAAGATNIILAVWMLRRKLRSLRPDRKAGASYLGIAEHSWPLLLNACTIFIMAQSDLWILAAFRPDNEVAVYGAVARLVLLTGMTLAIVNAVVPPLITRLNVQGQTHQLERILRTTATLAAIPAFAVLAIFMLFGDTVLGLVFGNYYRVGATVLLILSLGQGANVYAGSCGYTLIMTGHRKTMMLISVASAAVGVTSGLAWVQSYGATGVAAGFAMATVLQQALMLGFARYQCGVWTHAGLRYLFRSLSQVYRG
jgi:O-antigen/teichoic acid export membrane protein